jgi:hypothetical protein
MNKKILLLIASLLAFAILVTPVMAVSPKKIPITIERTGFFLITATKVWTSGNVWHGRGSIRGFSSVVITGNGMPTLSGSSSAVGNYDITLIMDMVQLT